MTQSNLKPGVKFLISVTIIHVVTYFIFGFLASSIFNYSEIFEKPIIRDYYKPFGSTSNYIGPLIQILRGMLFGFVLLPFKKTLEESRYGWLFLWLLFIGIGILGPPSAAPSSIEGVVYTKLPIWFHVIGFPEILLQTLTFSLVLHNNISDYKLIKSEKSLVLVKALSTACFSFIGYTIVSIGFALLAKASITENSADLRVLGQFIVPLALTFIAVILNNINNKLISAILYVLSALSLILYQSLLLGAGNWLYALIAPILPVILFMVLTKKKKVQ